MALVTGWIAVFLVAAAAAIPVEQWVRHKRRAAPDSTRTKVHAAIGMVTAAVAFAHVLTAVPVMGSSRALGGGMPAILAGSLGFFVIVAHSGVGLQLRSPKLRDRKAKRRLHVTTAITIAVTVGAHVVLLLLAPS